MSDPYRNDEVAKLQQENAKLREQNDALMWRYSVIKKWPMLLVLFGSFGAISALWYAAGKSSAPRVSTGSVFALSSDDRRAMGAEVAREVNARISAEIAKRESAEPFLPRVAAKRWSRSLRDMNTYRECVAENRSSKYPHMVFLPRNELVSDDFQYGSEDEFIFCALAGETIVFRMKAVKGSGIDSELTLLDDSGDELASDDDSGEGKDASLSFAFRRSGRYILRGEADWMFFWNNHSGDYTLSARRAE